MNCGTNNVFVEGLTSCDPLNLRNLDMSAGYIHRFLIELILEGSLCWMNAGDAGIRYLVIWCIVAIIGKLNLHL